ncbi:MAG: BON domain-containing protein [Candidatus Omnitrophota bacterium]|jgi:osmotically-inducible protein OsmY|nr:MAG: BON domain-containing protein [Candidatus Omnitrophota bacterium]
MNLRRFMLLLTVGFFCIALIGCASTKKVTLDDQTIANQIKTQLEAPAGPEGPFEINIIVNKGGVQLEGEVATVLAKEQAMAIAQSSEGVKDVKSFIQTK